MFIYVVVCNETLKIYVGQHKGTNLQHYLQQKLYEARKRLKARSHLYAALRKHPRESWSIYPLVSGVENRQELDALEQHYIQVLNTQHPDVGYNICRGGEGFTGPHTEEWRQETLARIQTYWSHPESHEERSRVMTERWARDPIARQVLSEQMKGNTYAQGRIQPEEEKQQRSLGMKGKQQRLGQTRSAEEKKKTSISLKQFYQEHPRGSATEEQKAALKSAHQTCSCPHHVRTRQKRQEQDLSFHK